MSMEGWFIDHSVWPRVCLPAGVSVGNCVDVTLASDSWRRYWEPVTGRVHDCAEYYKQYLADGRVEAKRQEKTA